MTELKVTLTWTYVPNPDHYPSDDVDEWVAVDKQAIEEDPAFFVPEKVEVTVETVGGNQ